MPPIEEYLADKVVELRKAHVTRYGHQRSQYNIQPAGSAAPTQAVVGGFVRSYKFDYTPGESFAQGTMCIHLESGPREFEVTMVLLGNGTHHGTMAERIVESTHKICDRSDAVVEAYFSAFCEKISSWVVVYERFDGYFNETCNTLPGFLKEGDPSCLTDHWRNQIRSFIVALSLARARGVVHGSLDNATSYVVSAGRVKLINVAKIIYRDNTFVDDVYDLRMFIQNNAFFNATSSAAWQSLHFLLGTELMGADTWVDVVLQHPILLEPEERIACYLQVQGFMWNDLDDIGRTEFANALFVKTPRYRWKRIIDFIDITNHVYYGLYQKLNELPRIYLAIIQFVKNMIHHANDYTVSIKEYWDEQRMVEEIEAVFPGYMDMAYSLSKLEGPDLDQLFNTDKALRLRCDFY